MKAELITRYGTWRDVADLARVTVGKEPGLNEPSNEWKLRMLKAEHSPIRVLNFGIILHDLPSWVSVHLTRHKIGIEHFVKSQREDRTGKPRGGQHELVNHFFIANAQALINISRKRLCNNASTETKEAWEMSLDTIREIEPELFSCCLPDCRYRGGCHEMHPCMMS